MTRAEHLEWAKHRAREYLDKGDWLSAWSSFLSDMGKHDELRGHDGLALGKIMVVGGHLSSTEKMREHIEGCS